MERNKTQITTVYLAKPETQGLHPFFCPDCRNMILQYEGEIVRIMPGLSRTTLPIVVECSNSNCKRKFNFISILEEI